MKVLEKIKSTGAKVALFATGVIASAMASAGDYSKVTEITSEIDSGETPVATVSAATAELLVIRRVWRIIKSSI